MMKNRVHIKLETLQDTSVVRYCSQCKDHVIFRDSKVKRHNANGKIYINMLFINAITITHGIRFLIS
ncbi:MAG: hypothetical protein JEZ08_23570 [Clostridiales bacterium]|nr:hypothetical protein [Clostridiales bacterium]